MACTTDLLPGSIGETLTLTLTWPDGFTGLTGLFKVGDFDTGALVTSASMTISGDPTIATVDLLIDMAKGKYQTELHLTDGGGDVQIVPGPTLVVTPAIG